MSKSLPFDTAPGAAEAGEELRRLKALLPSHLMYLGWFAKGDPLSKIASLAKVRSMQRTFETIRNVLRVETNEEAAAIFRRFEKDLDDD